MAGKGLRGARPGTYISQSAGSKVRAASPRSAFSTASASDRVTPIKRSLPAVFLVAIFCGPYPPQRLWAIIPVSDNFHNLFDAVHRVEDGAYTSAAMRPVAIGLDPPAIRRVPCCRLFLWILDSILYAPTPVSSNCGAALTF